MDNSTKSSQSESMKMLLKEPGGLSYVDRNTYQTGLEAEIETSNSRNHDKHLKEHGGQVFKQLNLRMSGLWMKMVKVL